MSRIQSTLDTLFQKHRIVFWYDAKRELRAEFESLLLPEVETIELNNNEFAVKHRILREQPARKFLLYRAGPEPAALDNWLLDVQLAHGVFQADQVAIWLAELELPPSYTELAQIHAGFFNAETRRLALKSLLNPRETTETSLRMQMLAVCAETEPRLDEILESLLAELARGSETRLDLIRRCGVDAFLWERLKREFGYESVAPGIQDFAIELFKSSYALMLEQPAKFNTEALVFLKRWKDSLSHQQSFESLSAQYVAILNIENDLQARDYRKLLDVDLFRVVDLKILSSLARDVAGRTIPTAECSSLVRQRRRSHWYAEFQHFYEALEHAAQFFKALDDASLRMESLFDGVERYSKTWYRLDTLYRRVIFHYRKAEYPAVLAQVVQNVENQYNTNYLYKLTNNWQAVLDTRSNWGAEPIASQREFFQRQVEPFLNNKKKVYVIISDALRYEVAAELLDRVRSEDRYEAEIIPMLGMLPSYTQLGMAALLPNHEISFAENESGAVVVDGLSTQGTANRDRILKQAIGQASAIRAEDLLNMSRDDCRALVRDNDVLYVYHNRIDAVGDKKETEERVFEAVEETFDELLTIIKKLTAANATNLLVTADHGFIYQNRALEDSDYSNADVSSSRITYKDRRFVLGKDLPAEPGLQKFNSSDVGLVGDTQIQLPKSIQRLRLSGSGSRYVHGGLSLQEVVVPVLQINKKRESDISRVTVDIIRGANSLITSGQVAVTFYQVQAVSPKVQARKLRVGIYTQSGALISDTHQLNFDLESENPREREIAVRFILTRETSQYNNQEVLLRMEEQVENTTHFQEYGSPLRYTLRRSFTSDFDF